MSARPLSLSWSALRVHEECRMKARLIREGKRNRAKDLRSYYHGMVVDSIMQAWLADPTRRPGQMRDMVDDQIDKGIDDARASGDGIVRWRNAEDRDHVRQFCVDLVDRLEPILTQLVLPHPFHAPFRFKVPVTLADDQRRTVNLVGEMDILVRTPTGWVVWDLKGTADDQYWRRVVGQLVFYDLAVLALHGERTRACGLIQPMCPEQVLPFVVTEDMRRDLWSRITRMAEQIWADDTACKDGTAGCSWCEVRHACPRYSPDEDTLGLGLRRAAQEMTG